MGAGQETTLSPFAHRLKDADIQGGTEDIDPAYAVRDAVHSTIPSKWLRKKKALEVVYRSLLRYLQKHTSYSLELEEPVNLDAISEDDDVEQTIQVAKLTAAKLQYHLTNICVQLVILFLVAAICGTVSNQGKYSARMEEFDQSELEKIQEIVSQKVGWKVKLWL